MDSMKKSQPVKKKVKGNAKKYEAYREAWTRIKQAQENGFFLEAITIQESIISDRLISFLSRPGADNTYTQQRENQSFFSFSKLIRCWRAEVPVPIQIDGFTDLIYAVDVWRESRNGAVHAIVKFDHTDEAQTIDTFLQAAMKVAIEGEQLARAVSKWQQKLKRQK